MIKLVCNYFYNDLYKNLSYLSLDEIWWYQEILRILNLYDLINILVKNFHSLIFYFAGKKLNEINFNFIFIY